jgi:hypothetical protein
LKKIIIAKFYSFSPESVRTSKKCAVQHRWRGAHGIPTLARGNEKKVEKNHYRKVLLVFT